MSTVNAIFTSLKMVEETVPGTLPTSGWRNVDQTEAPSFDTTVSVENLEIFSTHGQREEGREVSRKKDIGDVKTLGSADDLQFFLPGALDTTATNEDLDFRAAPALSTGFTVPALTASQAGRFQWVASGPASLIFAVNYANAANNGLKPLTAKPATSAVLLAFSGAVAETPPSNAIVQIAGIRPVLGDLAITVTGTTAVLTSNNNSVTNPIDFTTLGLTVGQAIYVGGLNLAEQFATGKGFGTIVSISATTINLKDVRGLVTHNGAGQRVDLLFGKFIRNVPATDALYKERSYGGELTMPKGSTGGADLYEYFSGQRVSELKLDVKGAELVKFSVKLMGTGYEVPSTTRKTGPSTARSTSRNRATSAAVDTYRIFIQDFKDDGTAPAWATTSVSSISLTLNRNLKATEVVGVSGPAFMTRGVFYADADMEVVFQDETLLNYIKGSRPVGSVSFACSNGLGGMFVDLSKMTFSDDKRSFTMGEPVKLSVKGEGLVNNLGYSIAFSTFPALPSAL